MLEQVAWATSQTHPATEAWSAIDADLQEGLRFECESDIEDIDSLRLELLEECVHAALRLEDSRSAWAAGAGPERVPLATKLHGPFLHWLVARFQYETDDPSLPRDFFGFLVLETLPPSGPDCRWRHR